MLIGIPKHWRFASLLMGHLQKTPSGHLARTTGSPRHLAKCGCLCCKVYSFTSESIYSAGVCIWNYTSQVDKTLPAGDFEVCGNLTPSLIGYGIYEADNHFTRAGYPDQACTVFEEWKIEVEAFDSFGLTACRLKWTCTDSVATGTWPVWPVDPAGCTGPTCTTTAIGTILYDNEINFRFNFTENACD